MRLKSRQDEKPARKRGGSNPCGSTLALTDNHLKLNSFHVSGTCLQRDLAGSCSPGNIGRQIHGISGPTAARALEEVMNARWDALGKEWTIIGTSLRISKIELHLTSWMKIQYNCLSSRQETSISSDTASMILIVSSFIFAHLFYFQGHDYRLGPY